MSFTYSQGLGICGDMLGYAPWGGARTKKRNLVLVREKTH